MVLRALVNMYFSDIISRILSGSNIKTSPKQQPGISFSEVMHNIAPAAGSDYTFKTGNAKTGNNIDSLILQAAKKYNLNPSLIRAVIKTESGFRPDAVSSAGAMGLMQLMPGTARWLGVNNAFDPAQNIDGGSRYLRQMLDQFDGDIKLALAAYNAGPGNVRKYSGIPPFKETQNYIPKVLNEMKRLDFRV